MIESSGMLIFWTTFLFSGAPVKIGVQPTVKVVFHKKLVNRSGTAYSWFWAFYFINVSLYLPKYDTTIQAVCNYI
jgi:hypothetical protein